MGHEKTDEELCGEADERRKLKQEIKNEILAELEAVRKQDEAPPTQTPIIAVEGSLPRQKNQISSQYWLIPKEIYGPLDAEFHFDMDPCPYPFVKDGIDIEWGKMNWVNPPFRSRDAINGHGPTAFVRKAIEEQKKGKTSVLILPVQSYVNMLVQAGAELRPCGRVKWIDATTGRTDPHSSTNVIFVLRGAPGPGPDIWCPSCGEWRVSAGGELCAACKKLGDKRAPSALILPMLTTARDYFKKQREGVRYDNGEPENQYEAGREDAYRDAEGTIEKIIHAIEKDGVRMKP
jgi:hypothetical protein